MKGVKPKTLCMAALTAVLAACSADEPPMPTPIRAVEIVTVVDTRPAKLELLPRAGRQKRLLVDRTKALSDIIVAGQRIVIEYQAEVCDTSLQVVPIKLIGAGTIPWGDVSVAGIDKIRRLPPAQARVLSSWTTMGYLNLQMLMDYDGTPRAFGVVADAATLDKDTLDCYLYNAGKAVSPQCVTSRTYGSFSLRETGADAERTVRLITL